MKDVFSIKKMEFAYGDRKITTDGDTWIAHDDGEFGKLTAQSMSSLIERIDNQYDRKKKEKFERFKAIALIWGNLVIVTVTSRADDGYWITDQRGERSKQKSTQLFKYDDEAQRVLDDLAAIDKEIESIKKRREIRRSFLKNLD